MSEEPENTEDAEIRADQWKNCVGCLVGLLVLGILVILLVTKGCSIEAPDFHDLSP
ncbi:MAG: hypothetical protein HKN23_08975 [Verrucomicrobiales bacterium]|nr:hypothetical protein [Verrucomicrobiales bacterium]